MPLLKSGAIESLRQSWPGANDRVYLLSGDFRVLCIDRRKRKLLWQSSELGARFSRHWLVDSGNHAAMVHSTVIPSDMVHSQGEVVTFDPLTGKIVARNLVTTLPATESSD